MIYILNNKKIFRKYGVFARSRALKDFDQNLLSQKLKVFMSIKKN